MNDDGKTAVMWKPIESAPKDWTRILGFADGEMAVVYWEKSYWNLNICGSYASDGEWNPTHWMPLPAAPEEDRR